MFAYKVRRLNERVSIKQYILRNLIPTCNFPNFVLGTCLQLLEKGFEVHVVVDACSSRTMIDRVVANERMKQAGAWLTTSESVILGLVGDSAHPKFRDCQKLIMTSAPDTGLLSLLSQKTGN